MRSCPCSQYFADSRRKITIALSSRVHRMTLSSSFLVFVSVILGGSKGAVEAAASYEEVNPYDWLNQCVPPFQASNFSTIIDYSNYFLIDEPAGLCADFLACAFESCILPQESIKVLNSGGDASAVSQESGLLDTLEENLNLPAYISFPKNAKEVVELVNVANDNCLTISIKNGGHSHHGASTMKGSLQLNLRELQGYAETSITQCTDEVSGAAVDDEPSRACRRATGNGKTAVIRVGGGEIWDIVYRAVLAWNQMQPDDTTKYDIVGGGAGSVASIGGWMQGGGLSIGDERMYGFGVDNVVELQMVLADGSHIKFGPTEWMDNNDPAVSLYPRVTKIEGRCNMNVVEDESQWEWGECASPVSFDKLWKVVRGGGGGTYGIVTSAYYQLHAHRPLFRVFPSPTAVNALGICAATEGCIQVLGKVLALFLINVLYDPEAIGLDEDTSNSCGAPVLAFDISWLLRGASSQLFCRNPDPVVTAWAEFTSSSPELAAFGADFIALARGVFSSTLVGSYPEAGLGHDGSRVPVGRILDEHPPATQYVTPGCWSILLPAEMLRAKTDGVLQVLAAVAPAHVIGGKSTIADPDSMSSVPHAERQAGYQGYLCPVFEAEEALWKALAQFNPPNLPDGEFYGGSEYNHIDNEWWGPLKADFATPCPVDSTMEEKEELCVPVLETVWGTNLLAELEAIKKEVDPNNMFKCYRCVGEHHEHVCNDPVVVVETDDVPDDDDVASGQPASAMFSFGAGFFWMIAAFGWLGYGSCL